MGQVDLYVENTMWRVGQDDFLHSFFSTVARRRTAGMAQRQVIAS